MARKVRVHYEAAIGQNAGSFGGFCTYARTDPHERVNTFSSACRSLGRVPNAGLATPAFGEGKGDAFGVDIESEKP